MNIFYLDSNPQIAAQYHCDKHVIKMILECAQLLYTAHWLLNPDDIREGAYKKTHANHPSAIWVRESVDNYMWVANLGWWLCKEYQYRYGEKKQHKTEAHIKWLMENPPSSIPKIGFTKFRLAMPDNFKKDDPIESYQLFYRESKMKERNIVRYTRREFPEFLKV